MRIKEFIGGFDQNISYLVWEKNEGIVIDTSIDPKKIFEFAKNHSVKIIYAVVMHSHFDHLIKLNEYRKRGIRLIGSKFLKEDVDIRVKDKDKINVKEINAEVLYTPGHTIDCICIKIGAHLFTSDTLFVGSYGRTDFGGNLGMLIKSIKRLFELPENTIIHPGHKYDEKLSSTIGEEKKNNAINAYF